MMNKNKYRELERYGRHLSLTSQEIAETIRSEIAKDLRAIKADLEKLAARKISSDMAEAKRKLDEQYIQPR